MNNLKKCVNTPKQTFAYAIYDNECFNIHSSDNGLNDFR